MLDTLLNNHPVGSSPVECWSLERKSYHHCQDTNVQYLSLCHRKKHLVPLNQLKSEIYTSHKHSGKMNTTHKHSGNLEKLK